LCERHVDECGGYSQSGADSDLRCEKERRERPKFIERESYGEESMEFLSECGKIESDGGDQIQADGQPDHGGDDEQCHCPRWISDRLLQQFMHEGQAGQSGDIETEVHDLNQEKENANMAALNCGDILGAGKERDGCGWVGEMRFLDLFGWLGENRERRLWEDDRRLLLDKLNWRQKAISPAGESFDEPRVRRGIAQGFAELIDYSVKAVIEIYKGIFGPQLLTQFLARDDFARPPQQREQHLEWLLLNAKTDSRFAQFPGARVGLVNSKAEESFRVVGRHRNHINSAVQMLRFPLMSIAVILVVSVYAVAVDLKPETNAAFNRYVQVTEERMQNEVRAGSFLWADGLAGGQRKEVYERLKRGEVVTQRLETLDGGAAIPVSGGLIHHWTGVVFIPGTSLAKTLKLLQAYDEHARIYAPRVVRSKLLEHSGDDFKFSLRLQETNVVTVILDTRYDVHYVRMDAARASSNSYSTRMAEVENAGQADEREKPVGRDDGYLWRLNSYWRFWERDGGVYVQLEAISLTRDIPEGLGWLVRPFVTTIPKESLVFTLSRTREALGEKRTEPRPQR